MKTDARTCRALSAVLAGRFDEQTPVGRIYEPPPREEPLRFCSNGRAANYGQTVFRALPRVMPRVWVWSRDHPDIVNTNCGAIGWYIDGAETSGGKAWLQFVSPLAVPSEGAAALALDTSADTLSHPRDGPANPPRVPPNRRAGVAPKPAGDLTEPPFVTNLDARRGGRRLGCRFFAVVFRAPESSEFHARVLRYGVARVARACSPAQSGHELPLVYDDCGVGRRIMRDVLRCAPLAADWFKPAQVLIVGLDVLFSPEGAEPPLVQITHQPHIELARESDEAFCGEQFVRGVFGGVIPALLDCAPAPRVMPGWGVVGRAKRGHSPRSD